MNRDDSFFRRRFQMKRLTLLSCVLGALTLLLLPGCETKVINQPPGDNKTVIHEHRDRGNDRPEIQNNIRVEDK
jgi:hypothetical protein